MGIAERKLREKHSLKRHILDVATQMFIEEGFEKASIRRIAEEVEYSPATLYLYFKDKYEIFTYIQEEAFDKFYTKLNEFSFIKDPLGRLKSIATSYLEFALEHPELYELMFIMKEPLVNMKPDEWQGKEKCYALLRSTVGACNDMNLIKKMLPEESTLIVWSFLHGLASLAIRDRLYMLGSRAEQKDKIKTSVDRIMELLRPNYF
ncbi:MAG: TetR/AcrR family transcriptional regulator [Cyclobacteriaceae bacterium]